MESESAIGNAERAAGITIVLLMVLGLIQIVLGEVVSGSVALTANGIDCVGDGFVSAVVWIGLKFFKRSADSRFHFGYFKIENLASVAAAVVMLILATFISYRAFMQFQNPHDIQIPLAGAVVALIAAVIAWAIGVYKFLKGRKLGFDSLKLDAINTLKDGTASCLAVIALVVSAKGYPIADAIVGFIIAAIIVSIGITTIKEAGYVLVDACDAECFLTRVEIQSMAESLPQVESAHVVRLRRTGPVIQGEIEITVPGDMSIREANDISVKILEMVRNRFSDVERLTIVAVPHMKELEKKEK